MAGSVYGKSFRTATFGESHGKAVGAVVDGCPAGLSLDENYIQSFLDRRKPGKGKFSTPRKEEDKVSILSGVFEGKTLGTPIALLIHNKDQNPKAYDELREVFRPGHADFTFLEKYGIRDHRGGGRSSGRETAGRVAAGAVAARFLSELDIKVSAYTRAIGPVRVPDKELSLEEALNNPLCIPDKETYEKAAEYVDTLIKEQDSAGGIIECIVENVPAGLGETVFDKLDAELAKAVMSIGAVKGFEIGDGFNAAGATGSENNDPFIMTGSGIKKETNHSGGTLGGMSDGSPIIFRAAVKPTPSIWRSQRTVTSSGEETTISISGRHDPLIVPRAVVVVESMAALVIADMVLRNMGSRMEYVKELYKERD